MEAKEFGQGHAVSQWWKWYLNSGELVPDLPSLQVHLLVCRIGSYVPLSLSESPVSVAFVA